VEIKKEINILRVGNIGKIDGQVHIQAMRNTHSWVYLRYITNHPEAASK
jgi:hypothetical protein